MDCLPLGNLQGWKRYTGVFPSSFLLLTYFPFPPPTTSMNFFWDYFLLGESSWFLFSSLVYLESRLFLFRPSIASFTWIQSLVLWSWFLWKREVFKGRYTSKLGLGLHLLSYLDLLESFSDGRLDLAFPGFLLLPWVFFKVYIGLCPTQ